jgi:LysR family transcriptional regulator, glycine cleavage system transcriptional activator
MRDLPLNALRAFACVLETGGVRSAARELRITHSAVSRHLRELEAWLDVPIIEAGGGRRPLALTPQGLELARHASTALRGLERAARAVRERHHSASVTVATAPSFAARWLLPRLAALGEDHARIELSLVVEQRVADPSSQGADFAIRMGRGPWPEAQAEPLMGDALVPVMSPSLWERSGRPSSPESLLRLRLLHDRDPHAHWELWRSQHGPPELDTRTGPRLVSSDLVLRAAEEGLGVALARERLAEEELRSGRLIRPFRDLVVDLPDAYWIVRAAGTQPRKAVATVVDWLRKEARTAAGTERSPITAW